MQQNSTSFVCLQAALLQANGGELTTEMLSPLLRAVPEQKEITDIQLYLKVCLISCKSVIASYSVEDLPTYRHEKLCPAQWQIGIFVSPCISSNWPSCLYFAQPAEFALLPVHSLSAYFPFRALGHKLALRTASATALHLALLGFVTADSCGCCCQPCYSLSHAAQQTLA